MNQFYRTENELFVKRNLTTTYNNLYSSKTRYPSRWVTSNGKKDSLLNTMLPSIRFPLSLKKDEISHEKLMLGSRFCPNYFFISANLTRITTFIETHQNNHLSRKNARYALLIEENEDTLNEFNSTSFFDNTIFFKKVLNLAVFLFTKNKEYNHASKETSFLSGPQSSFKQNR